MTPFLGPFIEPLMNQDTKIAIKIISLKNKAQGRQPTNHDWTVQGQHQQKQEVRSLSKTPTRR